MLENMTWSQQRDYWEKQAAELRQLPTIEMRVKKSLWLSWFAFIFLSFAVFFYIISFSGKVIYLNIEQFFSVLSIIGYVLTVIGWTLMGAYFYINKKIMDSCGKKYFYSATSVKGLFKALNAILWGLTILAFAISLIWIFTKSLEPFYGISRIIAAFYAFIGMLVCCVLLALFNMIMCYIALAKIAKEKY